MRVRLLHVTTRRSGTRALKEKRLEVESLSVGRGTNNDLTLNGLTISLRHASFHLRSDGVYVEKEEAPHVLVNGEASSNVRLAPGDVVRLGVFELRVLPNKAGDDLVLEVESKERRGDEREELAKRTRLGIEGGAFTRRKLAYGGVAIVLVAFLAVPLALGSFEGAWNSGSISRKHAFIADDCSACHSGFERVRNDGCLGCHAGVGNHAGSEVSTVSLDGARCASCHIEHNGLEGLAQIDAPMCQECHVDLTDTVAGTSLGNASDFADHHPEFRLYFVKEPGSGLREPRTWSPDLSETSGVHFNHLRHVGQVVPDAETGESINMRCDACHEPDAAGMLMKPVSFEEHCQSCHTLSFDERFPDTQVVHGDLDAMREQLEGLYSAWVLEGSFAEDAAAPEIVRFARPGRELTSEQAQVVKEWVDARVAEAEGTLMRGAGECARCHTIEPQADGSRGVSGVEIADVWMPKSEFRHETHGPFLCRDCHAGAAVYDPEFEPSIPRPAWSQPGERPYALYLPDQLPAGVVPSETSSDVLIEGIASCRSCHAGADAGPPRIASDCVLCHPYHRDEHGPMRDRAPAHTAAHFGLPLIETAGVGSLRGSGPARALEGVARAGSGPRSADRIDDASRGASGESGDGQIGRMADHASAGPRGGAPARGNL